MTLALYRLAGWLALPGLALATALARRHHRPGLWAERFGRAARSAPPNAPVIWIAGASNGELTSARPLIDRLLADHPAAHLLITAHTATGRDMVAGWDLPRVHARFAPWDVWPVLASLFARWRPVALIAVENEFWPLRMAMARTRGLPVLVVGARISARSAARAEHLGALTRAVTGQIDWLAPQDAASRDRFAALGVAELGPVEMLKAEATEATPPADWDALRAALPRAQTVMAASTHPGEEEIVLDAFAEARAAAPDLRLLLAPRHPRRAEELAALATARGFSLSRRSLGESIKNDVYLVDTLGELSALYGLARAAFIGGSLTDMGGHTPFEPARAGTLILHGPHLSNFAESYAALTEADAALAVTDAATLAAAFLTPPGDRPARARAALRAAPGQVAPEVSTRLAPYLKG